MGLWLYHQILNSDRPAKSSLIPVKWLSVGQVAVPAKTTAPRIRPSVEIPSMPDSQSFITSPTSRWYRSMTGTEACPTFLNFLNKFFCSFVNSDNPAKSPRVCHCEGEARSTLPLPGERRSIVSAFLQGDEVPKRGRFIRFAQNDNYTFLTFCTFVNSVKLAKSQKQS